MDNEEIIVDIAPICQKHGVTLTSLLANEAIFAPQFSGDASGQLFSIKGFGFEFSLFIRDSVVRFRRNGYVLSRPIVDSTSAAQVLASWSPYRLHLEVFSRAQAQAEDPSVVQSVEISPPLFVPSEFIKYAKKASLISDQKLETKEQAISLLHNSLHQVIGKLSENDVTKLFWDFDRGPREGRAKPKPKVETQSFSVIIALLQDYALLRGFSVLYEPKAGVGQADAVAVFALAGGGQVKIAIEAKNSHSKDIYSGLHEQLPHYIRAIDADYGVYVVLDYGMLEDSTSERMVISRARDLHLRLLDARPLENINVELIPLVKPSAPSKRR